MNTTKTCRKCGHPKPLSSFSKKTSSKDGLQDVCKVCANEYARQNYLDNTDRYKLKAYQRQHEIDAWLKEQKQKPCIDCGGTFPTYCMDFDHVPERGEKLIEVSQMARRKSSWALIHAEIAKCDLVCANCHRVRTHDRRQVKV